VTLTFSGLVLAQPGAVEVKGDVTVVAAAFEGLRSALAAVDYDVTRLAMAALTESRLPRGASGQQAPRRLPPRSVHAGRVRRRS
jgi:hypothetical protein